LLDAHDAQRWLSAPSSGSSNVFCRITAPTAQSRRTRLPVFFIVAMLAAASTLAYASLAADAGADVSGHPPLLVNRRSPDLS
jgi:hypothetical protein